MTLAYVDTSYLAAISLGEQSAPTLARRVAKFGEIVSSPLMEAELRATLIRERRDLDEVLVGSVDWVLPNRPLTPEIARVLEAGYVRGADCFHLAAALYRADNPAALTFLTLDARQRIVAKALGFKT